MPSFGITPTLLALVKHEEGWVAHPYICPAGYPTIGYGHRIPSMNYPVITAAQGLVLLGHDLEFKRNAVLQLSPGLSNESEARLAAIIDFCFNLGEGNYAASTLRKKVDAKDWAGAAIEMRRWVFATDPKTHKKFKLAGLVRRREITARWLETGND
jgi:lysozyme